MPHSTEIAWGLAALFNLALFSVGLCALMRGDRPEQIGALTNIVASLGSAVLRLLRLASWQAGSATVLVDAAVAITFFWLASRSSRFWPIWSFGLVLAIVAIDIAKLSLPHVTLLAFASGQVGYVYLALLTLAIGTFSAARHPRDPHHGFRPPCPTASSERPSDSSA